MQTTVGRSLCFPSEHPTTFTGPVIYPNADAFQLTASNLIRTRLKRSPRLVLICQGRYPSRELMYKLHNSSPQPLSCVFSTLNLFQSTYEYAYKRHAYFARINGCKFLHPLKSRRYREIYVPSNTGTHLKRRIPSSLMNVGETFSTILCELQRQIWIQHKR